MPKDKLHARVQEVRTNLEAMSPDVRMFFARVSDEILNFSQEQQVPPREVAAALGSVIGMMAMAEVQWDVSNERGIKEFLDYTSMAMQIGASMAKLNAAKPQP
jgi:hypothetical protein